MLFAALLSLSLDFPVERVLSEKNKVLDIRSLYRKVTLF